MLKPAKYLSLTRSPESGSSCVSFESASSRATNWSEEMPPSTSSVSRSTRCQSPPRFTRALLRAGSMWGLITIPEPQVGFVHQGRGPQRLAGGLLGHLVGSQLPQFFVDEGQELFGRVGIALLDCGKDSRDFAHNGLKGCLRGGDLSIATV